MSAQAPVHKITLMFCTASIWEQQTQNGILYNTTFTRSYQQGKQWKDSTSFGPADVGTISVLATLAAGWIASQMARNRAARAQQGGNANVQQHAGGANPQNRGTGGGAPRGNYGGAQQPLTPQDCGDPTANGPDTGTEVPW